MTFDFEKHLANQAAWSKATFGPGARTKGVCDHIRKELNEIEASAKQKVQADQEKRDLEFVKKRPKSRRIKK